MHFPGKKTIYIYDGLIKRNLPSNLEDFTYVEPFGGTFAIGNIIKDQVKQTIYNDIKEYPWVKKIVNADVIHHLDFVEMFERYDSPQTLFYIDPPYFKKEHVYGLEYCIEMHEGLCEILKNIKGKFIISYEDNTTILKMYRGFTVDYYDGDKPKHHREIIITNITR